MDGRNRLFASFRAIRLFSREMFFSLRVRLFSNPLPIYSLSLCWADARAATNDMTMNNIILCIGCFSYRLIHLLLLFVDHDLDFFFCCIVISFHDLHFLYFASRLHGPEPATEKQRRGSKFDLVMM